jgi:hypothetical protein
MQNMTEGHGCDSQSQADCPGLESSLRMIGVTLPALIGLFGVAFATISGRCTFQRRYVML